VRTWVQDGGGGFLGLRGVWLMLNGGIMMGTVCMILMGLFVVEKQGEIKS
jgi:hypothetical protein